jgi:hypothetical protein
MHQADGRRVFGDRAAIVKSDDWEGPAFQTCQNAGWVCRRFETSSRDEVLSYRKHQVIAPIDDLDSIAPLRQSDARLVPAVGSALKDKNAFGDLFGRA